SVSAPTSCPPTVAWWTPSTAAARIRIRPRRREAGRRCMTRTTTACWTSPRSSSAAPAPRRRNRRFGAKGRVATAISSISTSYQNAVPTLAESALGAPRSAAHGTTLPQEDGRAQQPDRQTGERHRPPLAQRVHGEREYRSNHPETGERGDDGPGLQ